MGTASQLETVNIFTADREKLGMNTIDDNETAQTNVALAVQLSETQKRVMKWIGKGWTACPGIGSSITVNGSRICNVDTMIVLQRMGLVQKDAQGYWSSTESGKVIAAQLGM